MEPAKLINYVVTSSTAAGDNTTDSITMLNNTSVTDYKEYWKKHAFLPVLDTIIFQLKERFSEDSLKTAASVDNLLKLNYNESLLFINYYKVIKFIIIVHFYHSD